MTLSAVTKDGEIINPSVLLALGRPEQAVMTSVRMAINTGIFCPHCLRETGKYHPVKFRNAQVRVKHFYHPANLDKASECSHYSNESEKHLAAKVAINDWIAQSKPDEQHLDCHWMKSDGVANRKPDEQHLDCHWMKSDGVANRKPDVWVRRGNVIEAHEIQISQISDSELKQRTLDLRQHGASVVHWYLYKSVFTKPNRQILHGLGAKVFSLWFEDGDVAFPRWQVDTGEGLESKPRGSNSADSCVVKHRARPVESRSINVVTHNRKPGWEGVIYDWPWNLPDMIDIQWIKVPEDYTVPSHPSRYPLRDVLLDGAEIQPKQALYR